MSTKNSKVSESIYPKDLDQINENNSKQLIEYFNDNTDNKFSDEQNIQFSDGPESNENEDNQEINEEQNEQNFNENNYENENDQKMKRSNHAEWNELINYLDNINEDIQNMDKDYYLEHKLQDMEDYTKKLPNQDENNENEDYQYNEEGEGEEEEKYNFEEEIVDENQYEEEYEEMVERNNIPKLEHSFNAMSENRPQLSQLHEDKLERIDKYNLSINGGRYNQLSDPNDTLNDYVPCHVVGDYEPKAKRERTLDAMKRTPSKTYHCQRVNSIKYNPISEVKYKKLPPEVFPLEGFHHGWQYYDAWEKSNKQNTALEKSAKAKLKDEITTYYNWLPNEWQRIATYALDYNNLDAMNDVINANFAKVTPL